MTQSKRQSDGSGVKYRKEELLQAERLKLFRDAAEAVLVPGREYTLQEAESAVDKFLKGKVK